MAFCIWFQNLIFCITCVYAALDFNDAVSIWGTILMPKTGIYPNTFNNVRFVEEDWVL